ncbi:response regulator transcription factor [Peribacillus asahii]|uniref:response regulator transcription factor n=1 Tax=Peribacillus asahii TaxID=228899 RepID=UPI0037FA59AD
MQLTKMEYNNVLCAVEELASKQLNTDINKYRTEVLDILNNVLGYNHSLFWFINENQKLIEPILLNIEEQSLQEYHQYFYKKDFLHPINLKKKKRVQKLNDVILFSEYLRSEYYNAFMKKNGFIDEMALYLEYNEELVGVIGLVRNNEEKQFTISDYIKLNYLAKQIESGFNLQRVMKSIEKESVLLTMREQEIVNHLQKGEKNKEIAQKLYVSENTIKKHLQNLYRKFNANNRTELLYKLNNM